MKLVVDANIIFSALIAGKLTDIFLSPKLELFAPELLFVEIRKHKEELKQKSHLSEEDFEIIFNLLRRRIRIVSMTRFIHNFRKAEELLEDHIKDAPYLALALELRCPFWSYEKRFKKIKDIECLTTKEVAKLIK